MLERLWGKDNTPALLVGVKTGAVFQNGGELSYVCLTS